jgi:F-type H+-transporting ATPase subunit epsilon
MAVGSKPFAVDLVTPTRAEPTVQCTFAAIPAWDGEIGILHGRAPLVCRLGDGELRLEEQGGQTRRFRISGGFAEVLDSVVTVLTSEAESAD